MAYMYRLLSAATSRRGYKLFRQQLINMGLDRLDGEEMFPTDKQVDQEVRKLYDTEYADSKLVRFMRPSEVCVRVCVTRMEQI